MKILVVQLLRLGDILLSAPVISGLRKKHPEAEIHILAFKKFSQVQELFPPGLHWHWIDRDGLLSALGDPNTPFFGAQDILEKDLKPLKEANFDVIYNLTQTRMSGWICSFIHAPDIFGLHFDQRAQARFGSPWFQYLNDYMAANQGEIFHYTDVFRFGCGVGSYQSEWPLRRTYAEALPAPYVLIQPLTSDTKKNYPMSGWRVVLKSFRARHPNIAVGVLAAPNEAPAIASGLEDIEGVHILVCSLGEALDHMDRALCLVTGDTSIKHLACAAKLPVLELSLGSSDYRKTGIYKSGSWILQGLVPCAPCSHSQSCSQVSHLCSEAIRPQTVTQAMSSIVDGTTSMPEECLETVISPMGYWITRTLRGEESPLHQCLEKSTWKFLLQRENQQQGLIPYGSESVNIQNVVEQLAPLDFLESATATVEKDAERMHAAMGRWMERPTDKTRRSACLESVHNFCQTHKNFHVSGIAYRSELWPAIDQRTVPFFHLRRLQTQVEEIFQRTQIQLKLIRSLKAQALDRRSQ